MLVTSLVIPFYDNKRNVLDNKGIDDSILKDDPPGNETIEPYIYYYAPINSFGFGDFKVVNWSFFKEYFKDSIDWLLEYKRYSNSAWTNGNEYLSIDKNWDESGFWKIILNFSCPVDVYTARFTLGLDKSCIDSYDRDDTEVLINFSIPYTNEIYPMMFNWSDLKQINGLTFTKGFNNGVFWFRFQKYTIPAGFYSFDPSFGISNYDSVEWITSATSTGKSYLWGSKAYCLTSGIADSIAVFFGTMSEDLDVRCSLYDYIDNSSIYAGQRIAYTEKITILNTWDNKEVTFYFPNPKPQVNSSTNYYLVVEALECNDISNYILKIWDNVSFSFYKIDSFPYSNISDSPLTAEVPIYNKTISIYCNYTESGGGWSNSAPVVSNVDPVNGSTSVALNRNISCSVVDADGNNSEVIFWSNVTGSRIAYQINSSVLNTTVKWAENIFNSASTTYYWEISVNDSNINQSYYYKFTTLANKSFKPVLWFNMSFSNQSFIWKQPLSFNLSFSNSTFRWRTPYNFNFSFSNQSFVWKQPLRFNLSFSNSTFIWRQPFNFNFSFSNTSITEYKNTLWFNMSFSNTSISNYKNTLNFNMSFSNTSIKSYQNVFNFNMSFSNQSFVWKQPMSFNFSFSNSSINIFKQPYSFNMSFSNSTFIWRKPLMFNFSFSNTLTYKDGLWFNISFSNTSKTETLNFNLSFSNSTVDIIIISNVYPLNNSFGIGLQPTVYATFNNTNGHTMNVTWYYGNSLTNCNTLLGQDLNITNSTQYELHFNASDRLKHYYWRIQANDGINYVNESYMFTTETMSMNPLPSGNILGIVGTVLGIFGLLALVLILGKRRRKKPNAPQYY